MDEQSKRFTDGSLNIWIVDDQQLIHENIKNVLHDAQWNVKLSSFYCCEDALHTLQQHPAPDIILQDISIPKKMGGIQALEVYKEKIPQTKVVMFTVFEDDSYVLESIRRGAKGYFAKSSPNIRLLDTIRDVMNGLMPIDPHVAGKVISYLTISSELHQEFNLTPRELEIVQLLAGKKNRFEIADTLLVSESTVKNHIHNIYDKLQVHTRTEAVLLAMKKHII